MSAYIMVPFFQAFTNNGEPLAGGKLFTYQAGTSTPKATYTDATGITPAANPVILDAAGRAAVWMTGAYKLALTDSADVPIGSPIDNVFSGFDTSNPISAVFTNTGLQIQDIDALQNLIIKPGSDLSSNRTLTITTGDADRNLTLTGDATLNQNVSTTASPTFATATLSASISTATYKPSGLYTYTNNTVSNSLTTETDLHTYTLPANFLTNGKRIVIKAQGVTANNGNAKTLRLYFGGVVLQAVTLSTGTAAAWSGEFEITSVGSSAQISIARPTMHGTSIVAAAVRTQQTVTDTAAIIVKITGQATANADMNAQFSTVEYFA